MAARNGTLEQHRLDEFAEGDRLAGQILSEIDQEYERTRIRQPEKPRGLARIGEAVRRALETLGGGSIAPAGSAATVAGAAARSLHSIANHSPLGHP